MEKREKEYIKNFERELSRQMHVVPWKRFDKGLLLALILFSSATLLMNILVLILYGV